MKWWPCSCKNQPWLPLMQCSTHSMRRPVLRVWGLGIPCHRLIPKSTQLAQGFSPSPGGPTQRDVPWLSPQRDALAWVLEWCPKGRKHYKMLTTFRQRALICPFCSIPSLQGERFLYFKTKSYTLLSKLGCSDTWQVKSKIWKDKDRISIFV